MAGPVIELYPGVEEHAFASMMVQLLRSNIEDRPAKLRDFKAMKGRVALVADDAETSMTMRFQGGKLTVYPGIHGAPDLTIKGPSDALIDMSRVPPLDRVPFLPDPRSDAARSLARAIADKRLTLSGLTKHPRLAFHLSRILSIY